MVKTRLKQVCSEKGLSLSALARATGMNQADVSRIANARLVPYKGQVERIVTALGWDGNPEELFEVVERSEV